MQAGAGILVVEVLPLLIFALDVRLQYPNSIILVPDVVVFLVFLSPLFFCLSLLLFADLVAGLV